MTAKYSKHCQNCVTELCKNKGMHSLLHIWDTHTHTHIMSWSQWCCAAGSKYEEMVGKKINQYMIHNASYCVFIMTAYLWQAASPRRQTFACVLLGRRSGPLTSQRMTGVTWGHRLACNGAVVWGSTCLNEVVAVSDAIHVGRVRVSLPPRCRVATS